MLDVTLKLHSIELQRAVRLDNSHDPVEAKVPSGGHVDNGIEIHLAAQSGIDTPRAKNPVWPAHFH